MNTNMHNNYARLSSKLATFIAVLTSFFFVACSEKPAKVVKEISKGFYYMSPPDFYVIKNIRKDGTVDVGYEWERLGGDELVGYPGIKLKLEGPAMVGNRFRYRTYFKEVYYESGEVRNVIEKITVESDKKKIYEAEMLQSSKVGENQPGTQ
ncbi:MAG: hypothetical protein WCO16_02175 [bacterium]